MSWFNVNRDSFRFSGSLVVASCFVACGPPMPEETMELSSSTSGLVAPCPYNLSGVTVDGTCECPSMTSFNRVEGTGVYPNDSHLCSAAVHSGAITTAGGQIWYRMKPSKSKYCGSTHNGVTSTTYNPYYGPSFSLDNAQVAELLPLAREYVVHTYSYRQTSNSQTYETTRSSTCMFAPVTVHFDSTQLFASSGSAYVQVYTMDDQWYPNFDNYVALSTVTHACESLCPPQ